MDGTTYYERPNPKSLEGMESKFGPIDTPPPSRGPYGVVNTMDGTKTGRGFIKPGMAPFGFTKDMDSFHNKSEFITALYSQRSFLIRLYQLFKRVTSKIDKYYFDELRNKQYLKWRRCSNGYFV